MKEAITSQATSEAEGILNEMIMFCMHVIIFRYKYAQFH